MKGQLVASKDISGKLCGAKKYIRKRYICKRINVASRNLRRIAHCSVWRHGVFHNKLTFVQQRESVLQDPLYTGLYRSYCTTVSFHVLNHS